MGVSIFDWRYVVFIHGIGCQGFVGVVLMRGRYVFEESVVEGKETMDPGCREKQKLGRNLCIDAVRKGLEVVQTVPMGCMSIT